MIDARSLSDAEIAQLVRFEVKHDQEFFWHAVDTGPFITSPESDQSKIGASVNCNDLFYWACADCENIWPEDLPALEQAIADCNAAYKHGDIYADSLWACRKRGMRPQKPVYKSKPKELHALFDACGPERDQ